MSYALAEKRFQSFEDIKKWVHSWIASKDEEFFRNRIRKLPEKLLLLFLNASIKWFPLVLGILSLKPILWITT